MGKQAKQAENQPEKNHLSMKLYKIRGDLQFCLHRRCHSPSGNVVGR